ncbi:hypothetical protein MYP_4101 [Sporocytophaga myxococcoides]|uniref:Outer membrane protein beta-barrel domain-containing protein n=2 Tax=Sporocytophaga myxococcoides TaxID=153721 RepID=A0A098LIQ3_9BACT|nr:hypothetical protein MYP_4101 [Sporocytophaga myxococcoides]
MIGLTSKMGKDDGMISNGFYWNLGIGFPSFKGTDITDSKRESQGVQFTLEAGNQWMFVKSDRIGFGLNVSWLTIGGSVYKLEGIDENVYDFHLGLLRFGPMASVGFGDNAAVDVFFNLNPTVKYNFWSTDQFDSNTLIYGAAWTPGVKFRFKKFAVGFENSFGRLKAQDLENSDVKAVKLSYMNPRILLGMKF